MVSGGTPSKDRRDLWDGGIPWASAKDLKSETLQDTEDHLTPAAIKEGAARLIPVPSVLVVVRGMILARTFPVSVARVPMAINQDLKCLVPQGDLDVRFLARLLQAASLESLSRLDEAGHGTKALRMDAWGSMPVPVPPLSEQTEIAAFLDRETAKIDALVKEKERLVELLIEKRRAVISQAVTRGLDPSARMVDSGLEWLGKVPAHWRSHRIKSLFRQEKRQGFDDKEVLSVYREFGVIRKDSRTDNFNKTPEDVSSYQLVQVGDLVVNKMKAWQGSLGISRLEGITSPDYIVFAPIHAEESEYLHLLLRSNGLVSTYLSISNGIRLAQWRLEPEAFLAQRVFLPPVDEQRSIAAFLHEQLDKWESLISEAELGIDLLKQRRSALIFVAATGKIDVRGVVDVSALEAG